MGRLFNEGGLAQRVVMRITWRPALSIMDTQFRALHHREKKVLQLFSLAEAQGPQSFFTLNRRNP